MGWTKYQLMQDMNDQADALRAAHCGWGYGWSNLYALRDDLRKYGAKEMNETFYSVTDEQGNKKSTYNSELAAITAAESYAKSNPGQKFFVTKTITKSYCAPAPSITTRL